MSALPLLVLTFLASYLVGAVPFGVLVARWRGVDLLHHGSGNIGATNVGRLLGRRFGVLVFLLDFAKGALPVLVATRWLPAADVGPDVLGVTAGVAAFLGHLFPVYLRFRGGKGVATGAGVVTVLMPGPALAALVAWLILVTATRYVSLASLAAAALLCALRLSLTPHPWATEQRVVTGFCLVAVALVFARHRGNIRRLFQGTENRLQEAPAMVQFGKVVHVLALGLWFGTVVFFTITGAVLFPAFQKEAAKPADERPLWFPLPAAYEKASPSDKFPDPLRLEQGSRAAGAAVGPLFPWFYGVQAVGGLLALVTALAWAFTQRGRAHVLRAAVLALALLGVGVGWWLERKVDYLRVPRNLYTDQVLLGSPPAPRLLQAAVDARAEFAAWHGYSLIVNFLTLALVAVGMALAAQLPTAPQPSAVTVNGPTAGAGRGTAPVKAGRG
jgi:acyl-phosphate glycerol 3-phosphate acyltransferase